MAAGARLQQFFDQTLNLIPNSPPRPDLQSASSKAVSLTKSKLTSHSLRIPGKRTNLSSIIKQLKEEISSEETADDYTGRRPVYYEERKKAMRDEESKRHEAAALARRLRLEQEERERKREEALLLARLQAERDAQEAAKVAEQHARDQEVKKSERLRTLQEQASKRKEYLAAMGKHVGTLRDSRKSLSEPRMAAFPRLSPKPVCVSHTTKRYEKSQFRRQLEQAEDAALEKSRTEASLKKRRIEMQKHYAEIVQEMFTPVVDPVKRKEAELNQLRTKIYLSQAETRRKSVEPLYKQSLSTSFCVMHEAKPKKKSLSVPRKKPTQPDFLKDVKKKIDMQIERLMEKEIPKGPVLRKEAVQQREQESHIRKELVKRLNPMSLAALKLTEDSDELLLTSVKAKLAMLQL